MDKNCQKKQFPRKTLYLALTVPMLALYFAIAVFLWQVGVLFFAIYCAFFMLVSLFQGYVCVHWQCPYIGRFAPCVGGFCLPASQIARLFKNVKRSEKTYNIIVNLAYVSFFGVILFPLYFLYRENFLLALLYVAIVGVYAAGFLLFICPICETRYVCPGGQTALKLKEMHKE